MTIKKITVFLLALLSTLMLMGAGGMTSEYDAVRRSGDTMSGNLETPGLTVSPGVATFTVLNVGRTTTTGLRTGKPTVLTNKVTEQSIPFDVELSAAASGVATLCFSITTTNETGNADGGGYTVFVSGHAVNSDGAVGGYNSAAFYSVMFTRVLDGAGTTGVTTPVTAIVTPVVAATSAANRTVTNVIFTTAETSEYAVQVLVTVSCAGSSGAVVGVRGTVRMVSSGFTTPPIITPR